MSRPAHAMVLVDTGRGRRPWFVGCSCGWPGTRRRRMKQAIAAWRQHKTRAPRPVSVTEWLAS